MKIKGSILVTGLFLLIGLCGIITSLTFHYWESMTLPLITSSLVIILACIQLGLDLRKRPKKDDSVKKGETTADDTLKKAELKRGTIILCWTAGFALATYILGFYIAIPVFSLAYLKTHSRRWLTSILFAVIITGFIYLVFNIVLKTILYRGLIFSLF
ncbi:MAG: tripartite tricarboxylate transporter TctB family protein [Dehalococcoidales bacterium]|nr:tripartite tricarboxylate transporter TctB family protein [Dehalococcoidales bacterium]